LGTGRQVAVALVSVIVDAVNYLTRQEWFVLCIIAGLLITGGMVKWYRAVHPPQALARQPIP
jgi:hypothetical protein